jgi:hypothetical protein
MIRRRAAHCPLSPQLRRYLEEGDYTGGPHPADVDVYRMGGQVNHGNLAALAAAWQEHAAEILARWRSATPPWAARRLAGLAMPATGRNGHAPRR